MNKSPHLTLVTPATTPTLRDRVRRPQVNVTRDIAQTILDSPPAPTSTQRLRTLSKTAIHYIQTLTTGLYSDVDRDQARKRYETAKNAMTVADLKDE